MVRASIEIHGSDLRSTCDATELAQAPSRDEAAQRAKPIPVKIFSSVALSIARGGDVERERHRPDLGIMPDALRDLSRRLRAKFVGAGHTKTAALAFTLRQSEGHHEGNILRRIASRPGLCPVRLQLAGGASAVGPARSG